MNFGEGRMQSRLVFNKPDDVGVCLVLFSSHRLQNPFIQGIALTKFPPADTQELQHSLQSKGVALWFGALESNSGW